ncbi:hypothetical protein EMIT0P12_30046 [Pseudomonas sp. IT-P12]
MNELFRSLALLILIDNCHVKNSKRRTSDPQDLRGSFPWFGTFVRQKALKIKDERPGVRY